MSLRLDYFFRFFYPIVFIAYLGIQLGILYDSWAVIILFIGLAFVLFLVYIVIKMKYRMEKSQIGCLPATLFYLTGKCCFK
jgi:hypothetical protein